MMTCAIASLCFVLGLAVMACAGPSMRIGVGGRSFTVTLEDSATARALLDRLPVTLDMEELNGNEKYRYLEEPLPSAPETVGHVHVGDVMLFGDDCLVIFYEGAGTSYRYTRIGRIEDPSGRKEALGKGSASVSFDR